MVHRTLLLPALTETSETYGHSVVKVFGLEGPSNVVLDGGVQKDSDDEKGDDDVELDGDAAEGAEEKDGRCPEALKHAEVLEGDVVVVRTAQVHQVCQRQGKQSYFRHVGIMLLDSS